MRPQQPTCPVCDGSMRRADIPKFYVFVCSTCDEVVQALQDGTVKPLGLLMSHAELDDDRVQAAISRPHVSDVASFVSVYENAVRTMSFELNAASGMLRTALAQAESRIDYALSRLSELGFASDEAMKVVEMLREAREILSPLPRRFQGLSNDVQSAEG